MNNDDTWVYLASQSPRRGELLSQLGLKFERLLPDIEEVREPGEEPKAYVSRLAKEKLLKALSFEREHEWPVIAADTIVVCDDEVLEKPHDKDDFLKMMTRLSGREHEVYTALAVGNANNNTVLTLSVSGVSFCTLSRDDIEAYWQSNEPRDKAGGYAIQGLGAKFVRTIKGSYSGIVGLPLFELNQILIKFR